MIFKYSCELVWIECCYGLPSSLS